LAPRTAEKAPFRILGAALDEVRAFVQALGEPPYRAEQILSWAYGKRVRDFAAMGNLPKALRERLAVSATLATTSVDQVRRSADGTTKLLVRLADGEAIEAVMIPEGRRNTACLSTQVGCPIGCVFCASGLGGLVRNLEPGEIVEQVLHVLDLLPEGKRLTNIVVMGIGEPLLNYAATRRALEVLTARWGLGLSPRRITVSTVGLPELIERLAADGPAVNLAVSLHASDDLTRSQLVPRARPIRDILAAARRYLRQTGREVTIEYVLVKGVNDSTADARELARLIGRAPFLVNLIPLNRVEGLGWEPPGPERVARFANALRGRGVRVHVRRRRGADIEGACGQLRLRPRAGSPT